MEKINFEELKSEIDTASIPNIEAKADEFINQINRNHGIRGQHAKISDDRYMDSNAVAENREEIRAEARMRAEQRRQTIAIANKIEKKQRWQKLINAGLAIVIAGTLGGFVAKYSASEIEHNDTTTLEQQDDYIVPTQAEFDAGLTQEQIQTKRALDEEENAKLKEIVEESQKQIEEENQALEQSIQERYSRSR